MKTTMKNKIFTLGLLLLILIGAMSCHEESDVVMSYANNDYLTFSEADSSFAGKYRVFWKALNINYTLWDYEKQNGLDWDEHYATYLPEFEALDKRATVTDEELKQLMEEMVAPLHDGHLMVEFKNHKTNKFVYASPGNIRNSVYEDFKLTEEFEPDLRHYESSIVESADYNSTVYAQLRNAFWGEGTGVSWAKKRSNELAAIESPTESEASEMAGLKNFLKEMEELKEEENLTRMVRLYNNISLRYSYLNIPYLDPIDETFINQGIHIVYHLFSDGIVYLYIDGFALYPYLNDKMYKATFDASNSHTASIVRHVKEVWMAWFNAVQQLHKEKKLKGVIIDVRNNGGGYASDFKYVLGSLMEKGGFQIGWQRYKRGLGRYDYSPLTPHIASTLESDHEVINDVPVVVLANMHSISMAEITSTAVKLMPNGKLIGTQTFGGLCALNDISTFSINYSGHIGVRNETPVYCYTPYLAFFDMDKKCHEGLGVEPDIRIDLDVNNFKKDGTDNQLERALQYIRTGN